VEITLSSEYVYEGRALKLRVDAVQMPDGRRSTREVVEHADVICVIAIDSDKNVLFVKQHRHAVGQELLEIPAGGIDGQETPEEATIREMQEETGFKPRKVTRLGGFWATPGYVHEYLHLLLAEDLVPGRLRAEDTDEITLVKIPLSQIPEVISRGDIQDAKSIAGLAIYLQKYK